MENMWGSKDGARRHKNASKVTRTSLTNPEHQSSAGGICAVCIKDGLCEIGKKSRTGQTMFPEPFGTSQFGAEKILPNLDDIQILPEIFGKAVNFHEVETESKIGGFKSRIPVCVAAMGSTKVASDHAEELVKGAAKAGIPLVIGENVLSTFGEKGLKKRIDFYLSEFNGKHGAVLVQGNAIEIKSGIFQLAKKFKAHGIEIKLGQGAKLNLGGEIKFKSRTEARKYKALGYHIVENPDGTFQRHTPVCEISSEKVKQLLLEAEKAGLPIWIKIAVGSGIIRFLTLVKKLVKKYHFPVKAVTIDGHGGGTGMSPWLIMNETSLPSASVLCIKKKYPFDIILAGGYTDGVDISKAIMLGASGVAMGRSFLIAANCQKHCPVIESKIKITGKEGIEKYIQALEQEIQMVCATQKVQKVKKLKFKRKNLFALSEEAREMFGINSKIKKAL